MRLSRRPGVIFGHPSSIITSSSRPPARSFYRLHAPSLRRTHLLAFDHQRVGQPRYCRAYSAEASSDKTASVRIAPERKPWRAAPHRRADEPVYELYFTCNTCKHRSGHSVSKQGYHHGTVLVQCPGCKNRHLISDHLKVFYDKGVTLQDIMKEKGESIKLGSLDQQGDVEFWDQESADAAEGQAEPDVKP